MIKLKKIGKSYFNGNNEVQVLKDLNLNIKQGEFISILGPSGCGKSTLLNLLGGLDTPTTGEMKVDEVSVSTYSENDWTIYRKNKVGVIFQSFNLIPHLSVIENVEIAMTLTGVSKKERRKRADILLKLVGLNQQIDNNVKNLSGGQKQRVAIARALANDPDIILADEPTGALDTDNSIQVMSILKKLKNEGKTIILVTHDKELVTGSDHIIHMKDGTVILDEVLSTSNEVTQNQDKVNKSKSMSFKTSMKLAVNNLKQKKWRTGLTAFGASIGICGIAIMVGLGIGLQNKVESEIKKISDEKVISVMKNTGGSFTSDNIKEIENIKKVSSVATSYIFLSEINTGKQSISTTFSTLKPHKDNNYFEKNEIIHGHAPLDTEKGILLSEKIVKSLKTSPDKIINKTIEVNLQLSSDDGSFNSTIKDRLKIVGISKDGPFGFEVAYLPAKLSEIYAEKSGKNTTATNITVSVKKASATDKVKEGD